MSVFGLWRDLLAIIVKQEPSGTTTKVMLSPKGGRLIYEEFSGADQKPSENSRFYIIKSPKAKTHVMNNSTVIELLIDLEDTDTVSELKE